MLAKDVMINNVVSVAKDVSLRHIARILIQHGISGVPVLDDNGAPLGMISESDLIAPMIEEKSDAIGRDWWLAHLAEGLPLSPDFLAHLDGVQRTAQDVMVSPVVTVSETTDVTKIAQLFITHRIKRLLVTRDNIVVGIVTRADLVRRIAEDIMPASPPGGMFAEAVVRLDNGFNSVADQDAIARTALPLLPEPVITANAFNALVQRFRHRKADQRLLEGQAVLSNRQDIVNSLLEQKLTEANWHDLVQQALAAAAAGESEMLLLRFPCQLCSDGGRAINVPELDWPNSLRGEAAQIYQFWERDLKPHGFHLTAQILDYPGGVPGDVGLRLVWG